MEDNDKDDNDYKGISALELDRVLGFCDDIKVIGFLMMITMRRSTVRGRTTRWRTTDNKLSHFQLAN